MSFLRWDESADAEAPATPLKTSLSKVPNRPKTALRGGVARATAASSSAEAVVASPSPLKPHKQGGKARAAHNPVFERLNPQGNPIVGNYHGEDDELDPENNAEQANSQASQSQNGNSYRHKLRAHQFDIALHETPMKPQELQRAKQMNAASRMRIMQDPESMATPAPRRTRCRAVENEAQKREKELQAELPQRVSRRALVAAPHPENDLFAMPTGKTPLRVGTKRVEHFQKQTHVHNVLRMVAEDGSPAGALADTSDEEGLDSDIEEQVIPGRKIIRDANRYQLSSQGFERMLDGISLRAGEDAESDEEQDAQDEEALRKGEELRVIPARRKHLEAARQQMQGSMRQVMTMRGSASEAQDDEDSDSEAERGAEAEDRLSRERRQRRLVQGQHQHRLWAPEDDEDEQ